MYGRSAGVVVGIIIGMRFRCINRMRGHSTSPLRRHHSRGETCPPPSGFKPWMSPVACMTRQRRVGLQTWVNGAAVHPSRSPPEREHSLGQWPKARASAGRQRRRTRVRSKRFRQVIARQRPRGVHGAGDGAGKRVDGEDTPGVAEPRRRTFPHRTLVLALKPPICLLMYFNLYSVQEIRPDAHCAE